MILWLIWQTYNKRIFEQKIISPVDTIEKAMDLLYELKNAMLQANSLKPTKSPKDWIAPNVDNFKLNTNASVSNSYGIGLGTVIYIHEGQVMVVGCKNGSAHLDPAVVEGLALVFGLQIAMDTGF